MSSSEYRRHQLFQWFEEAVGPERFETLLQEVIPPMDRRDIATKGDLRELEANVRGELTGSMGSMEARLTTQISSTMRTLFFGMIASNATLAGLVLAAVKLG